MCLDLARTILAYYGQFSAKANNKRKLLTVRRLDDIRSGRDACEYRQTNT